MVEVGDITVIAIGLVARVEVVDGEEAVDVIPLAF